MRPEEKQLLIILVCQRACRTAGRKFGLRGEDLADYTSDVLVKLLRRFRDRGLPEEELHPLVWKSAEQEMKKLVLAGNRHRTEEILGFVEEPVGGGKDPLSELIAREEEESFRQRLLLLGPQEREALEAPSAAELARQWGCPRRRVYYLRERARRVLGA
jgi:hypothetical protein